MFGRSSERHSSRLIATVKRFARSSVSTLDIESNAQLSPPPVGGVLWFRTARQSSDTRLAKGMNILITGASGMIGSAVRTRLTESGHRVFGLSRSDDSAPFRYDPTNDRVHLSKDTDLDAVVNLAGANIADKRWNTKQGRNTQQPSKAYPSTEPGSV